MKESKMIEAYLGVGRVLQKVVVTPILSRALETVLKGLERKEIGIMRRIEAIQTRAVINQLQY